MVADRPARALAARGVHYGWVIAALAFFYVLFATSALGVPGVLILPMAQDLGMSIGELSAPQGLRLALFGLVAPFAGGLMLRFGPRRMLTVAGVLLLLGLALTAASTSEWQLWLGTGVILGVAPGLTSLQLNALVSSRWFTARRGLVVGPMGGASATGVLVFMPLAAWIAEGWGWRAALLPSGLGILVMLGLCRLLFRGRPQEVGLPPYGEAVVPPVPPVPSGNFVRVSFAVLALRMRRPVFWVLAGAFAVCGVSSFGITQAHLVPYRGDIGVPMVSAAWLLAVIGVADLVGTIGSGWLSDRFDNRWLLSSYYAPPGRGRCPAGSRRRASPGARASRPGASSRRTAVLPPLLIFTELFIATRRAAGPRSLHPWDAWTLGPEEADNSPSYTARRGGATAISRIW